MPGHASAKSTIDVDVFRHFIGQARIASQILSHLTSVRALQNSPAVLLARAKELRDDLSSWRQSLPEAIRPPDRVPYLGPRPKVLSDATAQLHFIYYGSILAIHAVFMNPWIGQACGHLPVMMSDEDLQWNSDSAADAARSLIISSTQREVNTACHHW